jgi:ABC-2 type transport system ATP-binding protein
MAQALLCDPELFILDEPMSGLDPLGRRLFRNILRKLGQDGKTVFFSSHILDDVEALCSRVIVMAKGTVAYEGSLDALLSRASGDTECEVIGLSEEDRRELGTLGYDVTTNPRGLSSILVPAGKDICECQRYLCGKGLFCESVSKRIASLEDILYKKQQDGR